MDKIEQNLLKEIEEMKRIIESYFNEDFKLDGISYKEFFQNFDGKIDRDDEDVICHWKDYRVLRAKLQQHRETKKEILELIEKLRLKYRKIGSIKEQYFAEELKKQIEGK